jgi:flagellar protein FliJ
VARGLDFDPDERRRRIAQIETMIAEMAHAADQLDREIEAEQVRSGINDPTHYAYPTYAKAAGARRDNLKRSIEKLKEYL